MSTLKVNNIQDLAGQERFDIVLGTAVTASGTAVDFTGIPSFVNRVTLLLNGLSTTGVNALIFQLGTSGGIDASAYASAGTRVAAGSVASVNRTDGFVIPLSVAAELYSGAVVFSRFSGNTWTASGVLCNSNGAGGFNFLTAGVKTLSAALNRVRITTVGATDTFDAGSVNISWE